MVVLCALQLLLQIELLFVLEDDAYNAHMHGVRKTFEVVRL